MLTLNNIAIAGGDDILIKNFGATFFAGSLVNLYGSNGIGKTSLIKAIAGIKKPEHGEIDLGEDEDSISYLPHSNILDLELTALDNLSFWAELCDNEILIDSAIQYLGLESFLDKKTKNLSAGQKQLISLSQLIVMQKKIWLLDEPFSNLDEDNAIKLKQLISSKSYDGGVTILTSHKKLKFMDMININLNDYAA